MRILKKFGKSIEKSKIEKLVTLLQLTPFVEFLAKAGKIRSTRENFPQLTSFQLKYLSVLELFVSSFQLSDWSDISHEITGKELHP